MMSVRLRGRSGRDGRAWSMCPAFGGGRRQRLGTGWLKGAGVSAVAVVALLALLLAGSWSTTQARSGVWHRVLARQVASIPLTAQPEVSSVLGRADSAYRMVRLDALNPAQRFGVSFSRAGASVVAGPGRVRLALAAVGYASAVHPVGVVAPRAMGDRVTYARAGVREWYVNSPLGLEQGFDVRSRPAAGSGPLTLAVALSGDLRPRLAQGGVLLSGLGVRLRYGGLAVTDAAGRALRSWLQLARGELLIRVADHGARYPLRIDPFVQQAELTEGGASADGFGIAVAVSGNTIVVGASNRNDGAGPEEGAVYVFTRSGSGSWVQSAVLTPSDGESYERLGYAVAIDGNTIAAGAPGQNMGHGAVYVFTEPAGGWQNASQTAALTPSDAEGSSATLWRSPGPRSPPALQAGAPTRAACRRAPCTCSAGPARASGPTAPKQPS